MFVCVLVLAFFQKEDYQLKGYKLMIQASSYIDDDSQYHRNPQRILSLRERSFELAMKIRFDEKEIKKLAQSEEIIDRVAASYAIALSTMSNIDDKLFDLLLDDNNISRKLKPFSDNSVVSSFCFSSSKRFISLSYGLTYSTSRKHL